MFNMITAHRLIAMLRSFLHLLIAALAGLGTVPVSAAFDPLFSVISKGVTTAMDVRSAEDVKLDVEIDLDLSLKLREHKGDDFSDITVLVFARHAVLVGFAKTSAIRRLAEERVGHDKRLRSFKNAVQLGADSGNMLKNALMDEKINLNLTATPDVRSVNMRWKVYGGSVFLMGVAANQKEANLAVKTIRGLDGVKTVHSNLRTGK